MILTPDIFQGEITLGQVESLSVKASIKWFIEKYEPVFLTNVLGSELAAELAQGLSADPVEEKWTVLADMLKPCIANFVYTKYMRNKISETAGSGESIHFAETAERTSPWNKIVRTWNEMAEMLSNIDTILIQSSDYSQYCPNKEYKKINSIGI